MVRHRSAKPRFPGSNPGGTSRKNLVERRGFFNDINSLRGFVIYTSRVIFACGEWYACGRGWIYIISHSAWAEYIAICVSKLYHISSKRDISLKTSKGLISSIKTAKVTNINNISFYSEKWFCIILRCISFCFQSCALEKHTHEKSAFVQKTKALFLMKSPCGTNKEMKTLC